MIVVVGNATVDIAFRVERLPRPGETLLARQRTVDVGGKGLNQALTAHRAGARVRLCAALGGDEAAATIRARLDAEGFSPGGLVEVPCATDESIICVAPSGENCIVSTSEAAAHLAEADLERALMGLGAGDLVLLQGNLSQAMTYSSLARARAAGATTILNPSPIIFDYTGLWPLVDVAVLNLIEAGALTGKAEVGAALTALRSRDVGRVVASLGAEGALVLAAQQPTQVPAPSVDAVNTTGAGDVLVGVFAAGIDRGLDIVAAVRWAVAAASRKVTRHGTVSGFPTRDELAALAAAMALP